MIKVRCFMHENDTYINQEISYKDMMIYIYKEKITTTKSKDNKCVICQTHRKYTVYSQ